MTSLTISNRFRDNSAPGTLRPPRLTRILSLNTAKKPLVSRSLLHSPMSEFQTVANVRDVPDESGRCFPVGGTMVAVFRHGGTYFAINDFCPHMGASLSEGHVEEGMVMCPWHAWRFRLSDGLWCDNSRSGIRTATYDVRVLNDEIQIRLDEQGQPAATPPPDPA